MKLRRFYTKQKKRHSRLRHAVPGELRRQGVTLNNKLALVYNSFRKPNHQSSYDNIYHCCIQKTGSVWIGQIMADPIIFKYSGLSVYNFLGKPRSRQTDPITYINKPFPPNSIVSSLKISKDNFLSEIPKRATPYKVFFVFRDPRELIVSWYHSTKKNHLFDKDSKMAGVRKQLLSLSQEDGLTFTIDHFQDKGKFALLNSWAKYSAENFLPVKYEDLITDPIVQFRKLFLWLDVQIPEREFVDLLNAYSFENLTGRPIGSVDTESHMRGGGQSSWESQLTEDHLAHIYELTDDLITDLGYLK